MKIVTLVAATGIVAGVIYLNDTAFEQTSVGEDVEVIINGTHFIGKPQPSDHYVNPSVGLPTLDMAADVMRHDPLWDNAVPFITGTPMPMITEAARKPARFERVEVLVTDRQIEARAMLLALASSMERTLALTAPAFVSYIDPWSVVLAMNWSPFDPDARPTGRFWSPDLPHGASVLCDMPAPQIMLCG